MPGYHREAKLVQSHTQVWFYPSAFLSPSARDQLTSRLAEGILARSGEREREGGRGGKGGRGGEGRGGRQSDKEQRLCKPISQSRH